MAHISTDTGSVLPPDAAALVVDGAGELSFRMPDYPADTDVPRMVLLLTAVLIRSRDEAWIDEMLAELEAAPHD